MGIRVARHSAAESPWFTTDGARFGCLARLRVTNPANGKSVVAVALDDGPSCTLESSVAFPIP